MKHQPFIFNKLACGLLFQLFMCFSFCCRAQRRLTQSRLVRKRVRVPALRLRQRRCGA